MRLDKVANKLQAEESNNPAWQPERGRNVSTQLQNLRNLLNSDRNSVESQRRLETIDREMSLMTDILERERQRRPIGLPTQERGTSDLPESLPTTSRPSSLVRSRRRAFRPSERLQRHIERQNQVVRGDFSDPLGNPSRVTSPPALPPSIGDDLYGTESQANREQRFRSKRRKLDDGTFDDETRNISYGDEGRVKPGHLRMEIIRCDGGDYSESTTGSAQLVLHDDDKVYSTKENKCNMLLKHVGGIPFSLTQIVIKAPRDGFDSPIQEGMIFVAMNDDKLLEMTSRYEKYFPRSYRLHHPFRRTDHSRPSQEYLNSARSPLRSIDRSRYLRDPHPWSRYVENDSELETTLVPGFDVTFDDLSDNSGSPSYTPRSPMSWRDPDAEHTYRSFTAPNIANADNRDNASMTSSESEDEYAPPERDRGNFTDELDEEFAQHRRLLNHMRMAHDRGEHDFYTLHPSRRAQQDWSLFDSTARRPTTGRTGLRSSNTTQDEPSINNGTSIKTTSDSMNRTPMTVSDSQPPHAHFRMAETQTSIAINFDPPVAGRYILIKLWASCPASNIDIQCILPHGYGGPRFFPSIEIR